MAKSSGRLRKYAQSLFHTAFSNFESFYTSLKNSIREILNAMFLYVM